VVARDELADQLSQGDSRKLKRAWMKGDESCPGERRGVEACKQKRKEIKL
jgi:hypothetical protein